MIGTIANTIAILVGSAVGGTVRHGLKDKYQEILFVAMGLAATGLGINAVVQNMPQSNYPVLFIAQFPIPCSLFPVLVRKSILPFASFQKTMSKSLILGKGLKASVRSGCFRCICCGEGHWM